MASDDFDPLSDEEIAHRLARAKKELIESDLTQFARHHQCVIPTSIVALYNDHELLIKRHYLSRCGLVVRWFDPINQETFIHTADDGKRYAIFACVDDGYSFCFPIGNDPDDCQIRVLWDDGELDRIELTAADLVEATEEEI